MGAQRGGRHRQTTTLGPLGARWTALPPSVPRWTIPALLAPSWRLSGRSSLRPRMKIDICRQRLYKGAYDLAVAMAPLASLVTANRDLHPVQVSSWFTPHKPLSRNPNRQPAPGSKAAAALAFGSTLARSFKRPRNHSKTAACIRVPRPKGRDPHPSKHPSTVPPNLPPVQASQKPDQWTCLRRDTGAREYSMAARHHRHGAVRRL
jgi:hypothetical protein